MPYRSAVAKVRTPRSAWIDVALQALAAGGPEAIRIEALAGELGVTKGGFYWHFKDRQTLLDEMLDAWEKAGTDDIIARVNSHPGDPRTMLRQLFELAPSRERFAVELALRDWARRDKAVAERVQRVDTRRMDYVRSLFGRFCKDRDDVEVRCLLVYSLVIGGFMIAADHGKRTRTEVMQLAAEHLLR